MLVVSKLIFEFKALFFICELSFSSSEVEKKFISEKLARDRRGLLTLQLRKPHSEEFGDQLEEDHQQSETENNKRISWDGKVGKKNVDKNK